jgi:hypothetical protein
MRNGMAHQVRSWIGAGASAIDAHQRDLLQLVMLHPRAREKGLDRCIRVELNRRGDGLVAVSPDGQRESFAYRKCNVKRTGTGTVAARREVIEALRNEVYHSQTNAFRKDCGEIGTTKDVGHVQGHEFSDIVRMFETQVGDLRQLAVEKYPLFSSNDYTVYFLEDRSVAERWKALHRANAQLVMQTSKENEAQERRRRASSIRSQQP